MTKIIQSMPIRVRLDLAQEVESQSIASTLDTTQWTLHGRRNRVFILVAGNGIIQHRGEDIGLQAPSLVWVPTGQPAVLTLNAGSRGAWLAISDAALSQVALPGNIGDDLRRISARPQLGTRVERHVANRLATLIGTIEDELREGPAGSQEMVRHQLAIVSILLWRNSDLVPNDPQPAPRTVVANFLHLVDQQMRSHWSVADYAR
ncbi:MAG: AraC family transcriptional regulator, partial [Alphaproteobacteria bacterium]